MMKEDSTALYIGRFQPFHNGHLLMVKHAAKRHSNVIIGIGSAQEELTAKNPFSASQRFEMILRCLRSERINNCMIIPIDDINRNALWVPHIASKCPEFKVIYTNNKLTENLFIKAGYIVKNIFYSRVESRTEIPVENGTRIRNLMFMGMRWRQYVHSEVFSYINEKGLIDNIGRCLNE